MGKSYELVHEIEVPVDARQAWDALTVGPQLDSWFMGQNEIEPRVGGTTRMVHPFGFVEEATVAAWEPPTRFAFRGADQPDGRKNDFEYQIEERAPGRTTIRWIHTGVIPADWEAEYEAMGEGDPMYFDKLKQYLTYFAGRIAKQIDAFGPEAPDQTAAMARFREALGLDGPVSVGDRVTLTPDGLEPIDGEVDWVSPSFLGVRSDDALYRFVWAFTGFVMLGHHVFADDVDQAAESAAWRSWLDRSFS